VDLTLFKAEVRKAWSRPIFELAVVLAGLFSLNSVGTLFEIIPIVRFESTVNSIITDALVLNMKTQMLPLAIICAILVSLSFARDFEQGLMQTLLSLPMSRSSLFIVKFLAVVVPLTFLSWGLTVFFISLNFYHSATTLLVVIQQTAWALPLTFLALTFYGGLATMISLALKKTIPSALPTMLTVFFIWFITTLTPGSIGGLADYIVFTPFKAPLVTLGRVLGVRYPPGALENSLPAWGFLALTVFYALMFLVPTYLYFIRRFEVRE